MPFTNFYNTNANRAFPFLKGSVAVDGGPLSVANIDNGLIVDAGFVFGNKSRFAVGDIVFLASIVRQGDFFLIEFGSNAPELFDAPLTFSRHLTDEDWTVEFADPGGLGVSDSSISISGSGGPDDPCNEPLWSGYLVTGKMSDFALLLPADGSVTRLGSTAAIVEPALLQSLAGSAVSKLCLANDDRTRVTGTQDCPLPDPGIDPIHVSARCLIGDLVFKPGYNAIVSQDDRTGTITLGAAVGAGAGEPCAEIPLFTGEAPPLGSNLLEGGLSCNQVLRSINGVGGPQMPILAGPGVAVTAIPQDNTIIVNVTLAGLPILADTDTSSTSC